MVFLTIIYSHSLLLWSYLLDLSFGNEENVKGRDVCEVFLSLGLWMRPRGAERRGSLLLVPTTLLDAATQCSGLKI